MNIPRIALVLVLVLLASLICVGSPFSQSEEVQKLISEAKAGDSWAQFVLGMTYRAGMDVPRNPKEAVKWFHKAADLGHSGAMFDVGNYMKGELTPHPSGHLETTTRQHQQSTGGEENHSRRLWDVDHALHGTARPS